MNKAPNFAPMNHSERVWVRRLWDDVQDMVTLRKFMDVWQKAQASKPQQPPFTYRKP